MNTVTPEPTVVFKKDGTRWWTARIPEVPGAESHGRTKKEAKESALIAMALVLQLRPRSDSLKLAA